MVGGNFPQGQLPQNPIYDFTLGFSISTFIFDKKSHFEKLILLKTNFEIIFY